jgi:hypothetical protein
MGVLGGITPIVVTAIDDSLRKHGWDTTYGPAYWMLASGVGTVAACLAMRWHSPHCNYTATVWKQRQGAAGGVDGAGAAGAAAAAV